MAEVTDEIKFAKLKRFNLVMGFLHLIQGGLMLWLSNKYTVPVKETLLGYDAVNQTFTTVTNTIIDLRLGPMIAMFLFVSAIAHLSVSTYGYSWYVRNLKKGINYARWYEYAISSSIMIVLISQICGISDVAALLAIFGINASMILFGALQEKYEKPGKPSWLPFWFGSFAGIIPWIAIVIYVVAPGVSASPPGFVYGIIVSLFIFFNCFAINMILQYKKVGPWRDYLFGEKVYIILSLTAKALLAWQVFANVLVLK